MVVRRLHETDEDRARIYRSSPLKCESKSFTTERSRRRHPARCPGLDWNTSRPVHILLSNRRHEGDRISLQRRNPKAELLHVPFSTVECQSTDGRTEPAFRFFDESDDCGSRGGGGLLVSSPPRLSLMAEFSDVADQVRDNACCRVDVTIQPFEITYQRTSPSASFRSFGATASSVRFCRFRRRFRRMSSQQTKERASTCIL